jgi:hypothetical protein
LARTALAVSAAYVVGTIALSLWARRAVVDLLPRDLTGVQEIMVGPKPVLPFQKDVLIATPDAFRFGTLDLWPRARLRLSERIVWRTPDSPVVARALQQREVRGFAAWARYVWARVDETEDGYRVRLMDARYVRDESEPRPGFGAATVWLAR